MKEHTLNILGFIVVIIVVVVFITHRETIADILHIMAGICWNNPGLCY